MHTQGIPVSQALTKVLEFDNGALHGQHAVAVLVVVHSVRVALLSERQRADVMHTCCTHNAYHMYTNYIDCTENTYCVHTDSIKCTQNKTICVGRFN
jgi:hypothetical protein